MDLYNLNGEFLGCDIARPDISMFESIGVIGDSFASGVIDINGTLETHYNVSWPQILKRMTGCNVVNYTKGGLSTKTWLTDAEYGLAKLNSETANNLYVIALGINDGNQNIPVGTIADITSDNTNSFYSYYGRIIRAIHTHAPNAIIMLSTLARWADRYLPYSPAVKAIGAYYSYPVFDLSENDFFQSDFFADNQASGHPTAVTYSAMAKEYKNLIEAALEEKVADYAGYIG